MPPSFEQPSRCAAVVRRMVLREEELAYIAHLRTVY
jgi:hypothetical protein